MYATCHDRYNGDAGSEASGDTVCVQLNSYRSTEARTAWNEARANSDIIDMLPSSRVFILHAILVFLSRMVAKVMTHQLLN